MCRREVVQKREREDRKEKWIKRGNSRKGRRRLKEGIERWNVKINGKKGKRNARERSNEELEGTKVKLGRTRGR